MKRAVRRRRPIMSRRKLLWSHTPARAAGWSICSSKAAIPPTIIVATSPWTRHATESAAIMGSAARSMGASSLGRIVEQRADFAHQVLANPVRKAHPSAASFSSACRSSSARLFFSLAVFNWPHAASMSRPRGVRVGALIPASNTMLLNARMRSGVEHS